jgi:hypothetical protein
MAVFNTFPCWVCYLPIERYGLQHDCCIDCQELVDSNPPAEQSEESVRSQMAYAEGRRLELELQLDSRGLWSQP